MRGEPTLSVQLLTGPGCNSQQLLEKNLIFAAIQKPTCLTLLKLQLVQVRVTTRPRHRCFYTWKLTLALGVSSKRYIQAWLFLVPSDLGRGFYHHYQKRSWITFSTFHDALFLWAAQPQWVRNWSRCCSCSCALCAGRKKHIFPKRLRENKHTK